MAKPLPSAKDNFNITAEEETEVVAFLNEQLQNQFTVKDAGKEPAKRGRGRPPMDPEEKAKREEEKMNLESNSVKRAICKRNNVNSKK
jgi:hypothetical protein